MQKEHPVLWLSRCAVCVLALHIITHLQRLYVSLECSCISLPIDSLWYSTVRSWQMNPQSANFHTSCCPTPTHPSLPAHCQEQLLLTPPQIAVPASLAACLPSGLVRWIKCTQTANKLLHVSVQAFRAVWNTHKTCSPAWRVSDDTDDNLFAK